MFDETRPDYFNTYVYQDDVFFPASLLNSANRCWQFAYSYELYLGIQSPLSLCVDWFRSNHWLASPSLQVQYKEALVHVPSATLFNRRHIFAASPCSLLLLTVGSEVLIKSFPVFVFFWMDVTWTKMSYWCSPSCSDLGAALIQTKDSFLIISLLFRTAGAITLTSDSQFFKWKMPNCTAIRCLSTCTYAQVNLSTNMIFA
jgi:hypothetical protein